MNFKFTGLKTIISLILGLVGGYLFKYKCFGDCPNALLKTIIYHILGFAVVFIIVYILWSLVQKKR